MEYGCPVLLGVLLREIRVVLGGGETVGTVLRGPSAVLLFAMSFLQRESDRKREMDRYTSRESVTLSDDRRFFGFIQRKRVLWLVSSKRKCCSVPM